MALHVEDVFPPDSTESYEWAEAIACRAFHRMLKEWKSLAGEPERPEMEDVFGYLSDCMHDYRNGVVNHVWPGHLEWDHEPPSEYPVLMALPDED